jgi:hypothetical protein
LKFVILLFYLIYIGKHYLISISVFCLYDDIRPYEAELDEFHPKATRTLFIGNLEKDVTASELRKHFEQFGKIIVSWECFTQYLCNPFTVVCYLES